MKDLSAIRERYLSDDVPVRLGGLAANLARIKSFSDHPDHMDAVERLIEESKFFIEWTAVDTEIDVKVELIELQIKLALWQLRWPEIWDDSQKRASVREQAGDLSQRLLNRSGLISRKD